MINKQCILDLGCDDDAAVDLPVIDDVVDIYQIIMFVYAHYSAYPRKQAINVGNNFLHNTLHTSINNLTCHLAVVYSHVLFQLIPRSRYLGVILIY